MTERFERRRKQVLEGAQIKRQVYAGVLERLPEFLQPYVESLGRREQKEHLRTYLEGLLSDLQRKNVESIAYLHDQERNELQNFIGVSPWDYVPLFTRLTWEIGAELGEEDGVLVFDPSGFEKDGRNSVGVQRQWLGRLGKVDNGQVGVYLGYVSRQGHGVCDVRLYLPREWAGDRRRRRKAGIPKDIRFQTKHELALAMLDERGPSLPHRWISGDDEMGRSTRFRGDLRNRGEQYMLAVPSNTTIRDLEAKPLPYAVQGARRKAPFVSAAKWCQVLSASDWTWVGVRDGEKGPLEVEILKRRVQARTEGRRVGPEELLVVTRVREGTGWRTDYHLSNASPDTPLAELARIAKAEHRIEDCLKRAKSEAGLAHYEVRNWIGWHHHQVLAVMATWFLTREARRGEKVDASDNGLADAGTDRRSVA